MQHLVCNHMPWPSCLLFPCTNTEREREIEMEEEEKERVESDKKKAMKMDTRFGWMLRVGSSLTVPRKATCCLLPGACSTADTAVSSSERREEKSFLFLPFNKKDAGFILLPAILCFFLTFFLPFSTCLFAQIKLSRCLQCHSHLQLFDWTGHG